MAAIIAGVLGGCSVEQRIIEIESRVDATLLDELFADDTVLATSWVVDGRQWGVVGLACREEGHPDRPDGLYERSTRYQTGGAFTDISDPLPIEGDWTVHTAHYMPDCEPTTLSAVVEVRQVRDVANCDDIAGLEGIWEAKPEDLLAEASAEIGDDAGACVETGRRVGPSSTNAFTDAPERTDPVVIEVDALDLR